jgi:hypothetical protein
MRKRKTEEIRKLLAAAISMCDLSGLSEVKRIIHKAVNELGNLESERENKPGLPEKKTSAFPNPRAAIEALESELKKEREKLGGGAKNNLFVD